MAGAQASEAPASVAASRSPAVPTWRVIHQQAAPGRFAPARGGAQVRPHEWGRIIRSAAGKEKRDTVSRFAEGRRMASAWVYQDPKMVEKHGADAARWHVGRYNLEGWRPPAGSPHAASGVASRSELPRP